MYRRIMESEENEKQFRCRCARENDDLSILMSDRIYRHMSVTDVETIIEYGWNPEEVEGILNSRTPADHITRLAAWIRECGTTEDAYASSFSVRDDYCGYILDEDGNYPEEIEEGF